MQRDELLSILVTVKDEAQDKYKARIRGIFGSYSRGDATKSSDVDILVEFLEGATLLDFAALGNFLESKLKRKVDVVSERSLRKEIRPHVYRHLLEL